MVSFNNVPAALRTPLFYAEVSNAAAGGAVVQSPTLLIGQMLATGTADAAVPVPVSSVSQARALFGRGSMLAGMVEAYRAADPFGEILALPVEDDSGGTAPTGSIGFSGTATADGVIDLLIGGRRYQAAVSDGDAAAAVAAALTAEITADADAVVTATTSTTNTALTFRHKGTVGDAVAIVSDYYQEGQAPAGITMTLPNTDALGIGYLGSGATDPDVGAALAALGDAPADVWAHPYTDAANLTDVEAALNDTAGRWAWSRQIYGHAITAKRDTVANLGTLGNGRNAPHSTILGLDKIPTNPWEVAAEAAGRVAVSVGIDPARPFQTLPLTRTIPAWAPGQFTQTERNTLLYDGIATVYTISGTVRLERLITTYQTDAFGNPDASYLDANTLFTLAAILRRLKARVESEFPRHKIVDDGTPIAGGQAITTPRQIRGVLVSEYAAMIAAGLVEGADDFADHLIVERNADDPTRVDVYYPPDLANQLRILAVLAEFRLQYPTT